MSSGSGNLGENTGGTGPTLKPYLRRKKSSLGETKIAVLGAEGVGKSGEICFCYRTTKISLTISRLRQILLQTE